MLIWRGGLHPDEAPNFGWAFQAGPAFALGMFVVMAIAYIVMMIISFVLMLIFGAVLGGAGAFSPGAFQSGALSGGAMAVRSEEHTSELQSLMRISYAVFCLKKKKNK